MQDGRQSRTVLSAENTYVALSDILSVAFVFINVRMTTLGCVLQTGKHLQQYAFCGATAPVGPKALRSEGFSVTQSSTHTPLRLL